MGQNNSNKGTREHRLLPIYHHKWRFLKKPQGPVRPCAPCPDRRFEALLQTGKSPRVNHCLTGAPQIAQLVILWIFWSK